MSKKTNVYGEGNYEASRRYNDATKKFVEDGRVDDAARQAAPKSVAEAADLKRAEHAALLKSKEKRPPVREPGAPPPAVIDPVPEPRAPAEKEAGRAPRPGKGADRR